MDQKGRYKYTEEELDRNKILKSQQNELEELEKRSELLSEETSIVSGKSSLQHDELANLQESVDALKAKLLVLAKESGVKISIDEDPVNSQEIDVDKENDIPFLVDQKIPISDIPAWNDILEKANEAIEDDVILEDLLSAEEFQYCIEEVERINNEFSRRTKLNKTDIAFLMIATALQTARWIIIQKFMGKLGDRGERISSKEADEIKKKESRLWNEKKQDKHDYVDSEKYPTWKDIVLGRYRRVDGQKTQFKCPYDAQEGGPAGFDLGGRGAHRKNTLGHDPILGWIFGTANLMTCTISCSKEFMFATYRVIYPGAVFGEQILALIMFNEVYESLQEDKFRLPAALFAQLAHLKSDAFTPWGLPVPLVEAFSTDLAGKLYGEQYDSLRLAMDARKVGAQAGFSIIINMIISLLHGFFFNPEKDYRRDFYEVRTRKILVFSNVIATSINLAYVGVNAYMGNVGGALKKLDLGGLLVTLWRLFSDIRFITRVKEQFINEELDKVTAKEMAELDQMFEQLKTENNE